MKPVKLSPKEYKLEKQRKALAGDLRCTKCGNRIFDPDMSHRLPRGMGGGWRQDVGANAHTELVCRECHQKEPYELSKFNGEARAKR